MKYSHIGFLACLLASAAPAALASSLRDDSFEKPLVASGTEQFVNAGDKIGPWKVIGQGNIGLIGADYTVGGLSLQAKNGVQFVNLAGNQHLQAGIEQTFKTQPGTSYFLWFRIGTIQNAENGFHPHSTVDVTIDGVPQGIFKVFNHDAGQTKVTWGRVGFLFTATNAETTIDLINGDAANDGFCGLDGLSLKARAEP